MNIRLMCQILGEHGHAVDLLVFPTGRKIQLKNVHIIQIPNFIGVDFIPIGATWIKLVFDLFMTIVAFILCLRYRYDALHGIEEGGFLAVTLGRLFRIPSIFDMDSCISEQLGYYRFIGSELIRSGVAFVEKIVLRKSSAIITVCAALTQKARMWAPMNAIFQIEDVPLAIGHTEENSNKPVHHVMTRLREKRFLVIAYTGNLEGYQGIDLLLDAWLELLTRFSNGPKPDLVIVGGPAEKAAHYQKKILKNGIGGSIHFVGPRPAEEMHAWMEISDVLVSPRSEGDNTPLKIYSYMASMKPIVATRRKTHTQVLNDTNAFLAAPEPIKFADAILRALTEKADAKLRAESAKWLVDNTYNVDVFRKRLLMVYDSIVVRSRKKEFSKEVVR